MTSWNPHSLHSQEGKIFAVTGATSGIGYFIAEQLATTGAHIVLLGRSQSRLDNAQEQILDHVPGADLSKIQINLADLRAVAPAADQLNQLPRLDALVENAGIVSPTRDQAVTAQGYESAVGTNYLGHFALTALMLPLLLATSGSRVVHAGSYITGKIPVNINDLLSAQHYKARVAYAQSKHATEIFGFELERQLRDIDADVSSIVAHPGGCIDQLTPNRRGISHTPKFVHRAATLASGLAQGKDRGAWSMVRATIDPAATGGQYYGPQHRTHGLPVLAQPVPSSIDANNASVVWSLGEKVTGQTPGGLFIRA